MYILGLCLFKARTLKPLRETKKNSVANKDKVFFVHIIYCIYLLYSQFKENVTSVRRIVFVGITHNFSTFKDEYKH